MANRKTEFYMSVKAILDKTQVREDAKELQELLNKTNIDFNSDEFEKRVREIVNKMSKETLKTIGDSFNQAFTLLGKNPIKIDDLIQMPNAQMWKEMGRAAGALYSEGLSHAINTALHNVGKGIPSNVNDLLKTKREKLRETDYYRANRRANAMTFATDDGADIKELRESYLSKFIARDFKSVKEAESFLENTATQIRTSFQELGKMSGATTADREAIRAKVTSITDLYVQLLEGLRGLPNTTKGNRVAEDALAFIQGISRTNRGLINTKGFSTKVPTITDIDIGQQLEKEVLELSETSLLASKSIEEANGALKKFSSQSLEKVSQAITDAINTSQAGTKTKSRIDVAYNKYKSASQYGNWVDAQLTGLNFLNAYDPNSSSHTSNQDYVDLYEQLSPFQEQMRESLGLFTKAIENFIGNTKKSVNVTPKESKQPEVRAEKHDIKDAETVATAIEKVRKETDHRAETEKIITEELKKQIKLATEKSTTDDAKESMSLIGEGRVLDTVQGQDYAIDVNTMVQQLVANIQKNIVMSLHDHPNNIDAFTPADIKSFAKLYHGQGSQLNGIIANGIIKTIDFTGISQDVAMKIGQSFSDNLSAMVSKVGYLSFEDDNIRVSPEVEALAQTNPVQYAEIMDTLVVGINAALDQAFIDNGLESTVKDFDSSKVSELAKYIVDLQESSQSALAPIEKLKTLLSTVRPNHTFNWDEYDDIFQKFNSGEINGVDALNQINTRYTTKMNRRHELTDELNKYSDDTLSSQEIEDNLKKRAQILQQLRDENLLTEEIEQNYNDINHKLEERVTALRSQEFFAIFDESDPAFVKTKEPTITNDIKEEADARQSKVETIKAEDKHLDNVVEDKREEIQVRDENIAKINEETDAKKNLQSLETQEPQTQLSEQPIDEQPTPSVSDTENIQQAIDKTEEYTEALQENTQAQQENNKVEAQATEPVITENTQEAIADNNAEAESAQHVIEVYEEVKRAKVKTAELPDYTREDITDNEALIETLGRVAQKQKEVNETKAEEPESVVDEVTEDVQTEKPQVPVEVTVDPKEVTDVKETIEQIAENQPPEIPIEPEESKKKDDDDADKAQARADKLEKLALQYERLGDLQAKAEQGIATKINPDLFEKEIQLKQKSLDLTEDEITALKEKQKVQHDKTATAIADEQAKARAEEVEKLYQQAEKLGDLQAKVDDQHYTRTVQDPEQLKRTIEAKKESLKLSEEELAILKQRQQVQYDSTAKLLQDQQKKKDDNKDWMKRVKTAQASTGVNAANSIIGSGNKTVVGAIGVTGSTEEFVGKAKELSDKIRALEQLRNTIQAKGAETSAEDQVVLSKQIGLVKELKDEVAGYLAIHDKYSGDNATEIGDDISGFGNLSLDDYKAKLSEMVKASAKGQVTIKGFDNNTKELSYSVKVGANEFVNYSAAVDQITGKVVTLQGQTVKTESFFESIGRKMKELSAYFTGSSLIYGAVNQVKKGIQYVKEIDSALTELKKVTDETEESYDRFLDTAAKTADKVGSTIKEVVSSTADFARLNI